jgi:ribosomal protein S18 acetylase RimI-like enzyme
LETKPAQQHHAADLARLINLAGEGLPAHLWHGMIEGNESPLDVGARRAARKDGAFSYTNARICVENNEVLGMIVAYRLPDPYEIGELSDYPDVIRPLIELEARAPGSWYINAIATYPRHRGKGVARRLMADTEGRAAAAGCDAVSLIVAAENATAVRLYRHLDYTARHTLPIVPYPGGPPGGRWALMCKDIKAA